MAPGQPRTWDGVILLVADATLSNAYVGPFDRRIDQPTAGTVEELAVALKQCSKRVVVVSSPSELTQRIVKHRKSMVFPYWFGQRSRSRHALVPALCEANDTMFVGADAFTKTVCNDKELTKMVCRQVGLAVPRSAVVRSASDLRHLRDVRFPVMVKPNYEGTSLGIDDDNRCNTMAEVLELVPRLLDELQQPIIIEDFITGREFSVCILATRSGLKLRTGAWSIDGRKDFLDDRVYSYELKVTSKAQMRFEDATGLVKDEDIEKMKDCYSRFEKVDLLRIDGRISAGRCCILELTPDIFLGSGGEFAMGFGDLYPSYADFISEVVQNCLERYGAQLPVG